MPRLLENYGMDLLDEYEVPTPDRRVTSDPSEVRSLAHELSSEIVIKSLVPVGKRMKGGGIKFASSPEEAEAVATEILGSEVHSYPVEQVLVMERVQVENELFLSFTLDSENQTPLAVLSTKGGIDVESEESGDTVYKLPLDPNQTFYRYKARDGWRSLGLTRDSLVNVADATARLAKTFLEKDLDTLEINPLILTPKHKAVAVAVVAKPDKATKFRHPSLIENTYPGSDNLWRPPNQRELRMQKINETYEGGDITYMELGGNAGLVMYSGGMSLQTIDALIKNDIAPANYSDINPPASYEKTYELTKIILNREGVSALLGTGNIANLSRVDIRVKGIVDAIKNCDVDPTNFPVVIRMAGEGQEEARKLADSVDGIEYYADEKTVIEAIEEFTQRMQDRDLDRDSMSRSDIV